MLGFVVWAMMAAALVGIGCRQRRELGVAWSTLVVRAMWSAGLALLPAIAAVLVRAVVGSTLADSAARELECIDHSHGVLIGVSVFACFAAESGYLRRLSRYVPTRVEPRAGSGPMVERVRALSARLGVEGPQVFEVGSGVGREFAFAGAASILRPVVLVSDGLVKRYDGESLDSVLAHELGHIKCRTVFWMRFDRIAAWTFCAALSILGSPFVFGALAIALHVRPRFWARAHEFAADRAASAVVGPHATAAMLKQIHENNALPASVVLLRWHHALGTHPALVERLDTVRGVGGRIDVDTSELAAQRRTNVVAWLSTGLLFLAVGLGGFGVLIPAALAVAAAVVIGCAPLMLWFWISLPIHAAAWRMRTRSAISPRFVHGIALLTVLGLVAVFAVSKWSALAGYAGLVAVWASWTWFRSERRIASLREALDRQDPGLFLERLEKMPRSMRDHPRNRWLSAICLAALEDIDGAIETLEDVVRRNPRYNGARIALASLWQYRDTARACSLVDEVVKELPDHHLALSVAAGVRVRCGELDEARELAGRSVSAMPTAVEPHLAVAEVELAEGRLEEAEAALRRAFAKEPGHICGMALRAELLFLRGECDEARAVLARAQDELASRPLTLQHGRLRETSDRLSGCVHCSG